MGQPKKLELTIDKLIEIAIEINKNTIANRNRSKDDKIPTDKLIRGFGINRKNFSVTIQDTDIKYNKSTFLYDIPSEFITNSKSDTIVIDSETNVKTVNKPNNDSEIIVSPQSETIVSLSKTDLESFDKRIKSIEEMKYEFEEINNWY